MQQFRPLAAMRSERHRRLLTATLGGGFAVILQIAAGIVVNLYVTVPVHHPGSHPSDYLTGSARSVAWATTSGPAWLVVHAVLGFAVGLMAIVLVVRALAARAGVITVLHVLAGLLILGAGFNGASFLDFGGQDISSLVMALLGLGALACYLTSGYVQGIRMLRYD